MEPRSLQYVAEAAGGALRPGTAARMVNRVCTDSRVAKRDDLFVALHGARFDGHDYVQDVVRKGAAAVLVESERVPDPQLDAGVVLVEDTRRALGCLSARYREDFDLPVIAVGGSNGKTTTKDLLGAVLRQRFRTLCSEASYNNDIGVPLTLLSLERAHEVAVLEVGTNHPGELAPLVRMIRPQLGVITSLGREHLEFFGDLDGVAREEGQLAELLPADGCLIVHGDSPGMEGVLRRTAARVVRTGWGPHNDWRVGKVASDVAGAEFELATARADYCGSYRVNLVGRHQVANALLAVAAAAELGVPPAEVRSGLLECKPARRRLEIFSLDGVWLLDDAYNANADSVRAALETLRDFPCEGRRVAVLGDMAELGRESEAAHAEIGRLSAELAVDQLFTVGKMAGIVGSAARAAGLNRVIELPAAEVAAGAVSSFVKRADVVLVKASRATRLEQVSDALRGRVRAP